jgi:hypothetical protein
MVNPYRYTHLGLRGTAYAYPEERGADDSVEEDRAEVDELVVDGLILTSP